MTRQVDVKALVSHIVKGDGLDKCRICMGDTSQGLVFLEDTVMLDGDKPVTLAELLQVITGVEVEPDDDLPTGICPACSDSALGAAEFRTLCRQAAKKWDNTLQLLHTLPLHQYSKDSEKLFAILTDNDVCIINDSSNNSTSPKKLSPCMIIKTKENQEDRKEYAKNHHCQCPSCGKIFKYAQHLSQHLKESSDYIRACHMCAKIMPREELVKHLTQVHNIEPYNCKKCPALYRSRKQYKQHLIKAHAPGACICGDCGRSFQSSHAFRAHLSIHSLKTCPGCDKVFRNQKCYLYHVKHCCNLDKKRVDTHRTKYKVTVVVKNKENKKVKVGMRGSTYKECICDYCKKKFAGKKFVTAHIQIVHTKDTHRPCMYCGKLLASAHMSTHLKKHESAESYKCEHCSVILKTKLGFSQHLRLHTGEKPYTCQYCGESFSASSRRSEHIRNLHKKSEIVLKYGCDYCPARFRLPFKLKKHIESVHSNGTNTGPWFECAVCKELFINCRSLLHHSRKHQ